jgi:crotonobetainyl-CoA:carnitine CoA-transferase CaiB-like acyl-CoA transferase
MSEVLQGLCVIEMGTFITGPAAGVLLADFGADVIKVEKPLSGDPFRTSPDGSLYNVNFQAFNRNKRSIALDTTDEADLRAFDALIAGADVFIQNFRPGAAEKLNVGFDRLQSINPRLVYCSISGFGPDGPASQRPCYDTVAQAISGYLDLTLNPENPRVLGPAVADSITGMYAAYGILAALQGRTKTGGGKLVEVSMLAAMAHFNVDAFTHYYVDGELMTPYTRPAASQAHVLTCRDGKRIALHMSTPVKFWENLVKATSHPELFDDPRFSERGARLRNHGEIIKVLDGYFKEHDRDEWCRRLEWYDVPHSPVYSASEALESPQAIHLGLKVTCKSPVGGKFTTVRNPVVFDRQAGVTVRPPPFLDQDRKEVMDSTNTRETTCS